MSWCQPVALLNAGFLVMMQLWWACDNSSEGPSIGCRRLANCGDVAHSRYSGSRAQACIRRRTVRPAGRIDRRRRTRIPDLGLVFQRLRFGAKVAPCQCLHAFARRIRREPAHDDETVAGELVEFCGREAVQGMDCGNQSEARILPGTGACLRNIGKADASPITSHRSPITVSRQRYAALNFSSASLPGQSSFSPSLLNGDSTVPRCACRSSGSGST